MKLFAIFDKKAMTYGNPFPAPTEIHAMRDFSMAVNRKQDGNMYNYAPEDFALYAIGTYNDSTGHIESNTPALIAEASALIKKENR